MCLLKPGLTNPLCGHQECSSFYMLTKKACMYTHPSNASKTLQNLQASISGLPAVQTTAPITRLSPTTLKRQLNASGDTYVDDELDVQLNKKKLKQESIVQSSNEFYQPVQNIQTHINISNSIPNMYTGAALEQINNQRFNQNFNYANMVPNQPSLLQKLQGYQNVPSVNQEMTLNSALQNQMNASIMHSYSQASLSNYESPIQTASQSSKTIQVPNNFEDMMNSFQNKIMDMITDRNRVIEDLSRRNNSVQDTLSHLINEVQLLRNTVTSTAEPKTASKSSTKSSLLQQTLNNPTESITSDELLTHLYGDNTNFEYQLVLEQNPSLPFYREKNFELAVRLTDKNGNPVDNANKIPLKISVYTCESNPKYIDSNVAGNKIFKGCTEHDLYKGSAMFDKLQIKEVTSHFRNGWIFIVVHPLLNNSASSNIFIGKDSTVVNSDKIKPLILERVVVKAKKPKEKEDREDKDEKVEVFEYKAEEY